MPTKRTALMALLLAVASTGALAQTDVSDFRPGVTLDGVNYFLPKTRLRVVVVAEKAVTTPGEFAAYANRYLRLTDVPTAEQTLWTIRRVELRPYGAPDPSKAYNIKLKSKTSAPLVSLTQDGLLLGVNTTVEPEAEQPLPERIDAPQPLRGRDYMTQEILAAGSTAKMAQLTAEEIYDIRDSRNALIRGEADNTPKDGAQLKLMLDNIDHQLSALESLFKGQTLSSTEVLTFDVEPSADALGGGRKMVARFSRRLGLVDIDDLSGEPLYLELQPTGSLPATTSDPDADRRKAKMEQGLRVNQPARVQATLSTSAAALATAEVAMPQFGTVEILSDALFNKKMDTRILIHQHTGSVKQVAGAE